MTEAAPAEAGTTETRATEAVETEAGTRETAPAEAVPIEAMPIEAMPIEAVPIEAMPIEAVPGEASAQTDQPELDGLPVRVRQANLAPQLRTPTVPIAAAEDKLAAGPSPEAARNTMASLQLGWQRGRITEPPEGEFRTSPTPQGPGDPPDEGEAE